MGSPQLNLELSRQYTQRARSTAICHSTPETMAHWIFSTLFTYFQPTIDALTVQSIPWRLRWRMVASQPLLFLAYSISAAPWWLFRRQRPFKVEYLPITPNRRVRALIFNPPRNAPTHYKLRPLHLDCHAGAFIGGVPEASVPFCARVAAETGAVVIATTYRFAPRHVFPAAIDDVDAVLAYLRENARDKYGADPECITVSGASAGGNLALATSLSVPPGTIKAAVTFYAPVDLRIHPRQKPRSGGLPSRDPMAFMLDLYDAYAGPARRTKVDNPRMSPILAKVDELPLRMLFVVAGVDIVVAEQMSMVNRLQEDMDREPERLQSRSVEMLYLEKAFHGWLEVPASVVPAEWTEKAFSAGLKLIRDAHRDFSRKTS